MDEIKRSRTFVWSTETPYNGFYGWEHGYFGHIAKSGKIELRRLELHGCASHPPGRYSATGGALGRALVRASCRAVMTDFCSHPLTYSRFRVRHDAGVFGPNGGHEQHANGEKTRKPGFFWGLGIDTSY